MEMGIRQPRSEVKFKELLVGKLQGKNQLEKLDLDWKL
jgi:hypothetical protein